MAIVPTLLEDGGPSTDASSYNTDAFTPVANTLTLAFVASALSKTNEPTLTGCNVTWTKVATYKPEGTRVTIFRAVGASPSNGAVTIDFASETQNNCRWAFVSLAGADISGTNGAGAIVQTGQDQGDADSCDITFGSAISDTANITIGVCAGNTGTIAEGSGFTEISYVQSEGDFSVEWKTNTDTAMDWTTSGANNLVGLAAEIKIAPSSGFFALL